VKDSLSLSEQLKLFKTRKLNVGSDRAAQLFLYDNSYFRFSGYSRYFQKAPHLGPTKDDDFREGTTFEEIRDIYELDGELRRWLFDGISELEVVITSRLAYQMSTRLGAACYLDPDTYEPRLNKEGVELRKKLIAGIEDDIEDSAEPFIVGHVNKGETPPIWEVFEILTFGKISKIFGLLADTDIKDAIAKSFGYALDKKIQTDEFARCIHAISVLRNTCAHHGRLWNRIPAPSPTVLDRLKVEKPRDIYHQSPWSLIVVLSDLVDQIRGNDSYSQGVSDLARSSKALLEGLQKPRRL
jgi:abortive infection bacteriophage resistance protein